MTTRDPEPAAGKPYPVGVRRTDGGAEAAREAPGMAIDAPPPEAARTTSAAAPAVLRVTGVAKSFHRGLWPRRRTIAVLSDACLEVGPGELVGLVGENGSGKSTLMQIIVGLLGRDAGEVERPARVGYCPQVPMLWDKLTVDEHFELFAYAYGLEPDAATRSIDALLAELDFARYRGYRIEELSGGTRQKLNLALSLMHEPQLLLLDEPYSGFDWETYLRFWEMSERRRDAGMAILIVSHLLAERERLDRMLEIRDRRVCGC
ncbi:MAG TPA: ABC transporter ATP-binding protein [Gemmatimonadales bacterium]|nr:ABC transporter ATP-binding protein [Gemmatimonadales bacterium]